MEPFDSIFQVAILMTLVGILCISCLHFIHNKQIEVLGCNHVVSAPEECDHHYEVVVVGGGILGSAIGATLSQDGRKVLIVERDLSEPDRIVGELLQPGGYIALQRLGLQGAVENIDAHSIFGYVVHNQSTKRNVTLSYPTNSNNEIVTGRAFHHGRFVMGLREQARKYGAKLTEGTVKSLLEDKKGNIVGINFKEKKSSLNMSVQADLTVVADGCFSKFRKSFTSPSVTVSSHFAGTIMHNCPEHKSGYAEIILTSHGPVLIYQISSIATRILIDIQGNWPSDINTFMKDEIAPQLTAQVQKPFEDALKKGKFRSMPNSYLPPSVCHRPGILLLGDAFNMRHPLTGAGMTVALNDVLMWRNLLQSVPDLKNYCHVLMKQKTFLWKRKRSHSFVVNILAQALYKLFSAGDRDLLELRHACFEYFQLGGRAVTDPIGLLSVLHPNPVLLVGHFFAVSLYAIYRIMKSCNIWTLHFGIYRSTAVFFKACQIIIPLIRSELV